MHVTRRNLAVAGALALSVPNLLRSSSAFAEAADDAAVKQSVEAECNFAVRHYAEPSTKSAIGYPILGIDGVLFDPTC